MHDPCVGLDSGDRSDVHSFMSQLYIFVFRDVSVVACCQQIAFGTIL